MWREFVYRFTFLILLLFSILQVYQSIAKFVKGQTITSSFTRPLEPNESIIFPSMTVCDSNGFKSREIMEKFNMTKFVLLRGIEKWPSNDKDVETAWKEITFNVDDLIESINVRYNGGTYLRCHNLHDPKCNDVYSIIPLNTVHYGRCYTIEVSRKSHFYAFDNIVLVYKRKINLFVHGLGQEIGIVGSFFPVDPLMYQLAFNTQYKINFDLIYDVTDEKLNCDETLDEDDYYKCARQWIYGNMTSWSHPRFGREHGYQGIPCSLPMYSYVLDQNNSEQRSLEVCTNQKKANLSLWMGREALRPLIQMSVPNCRKPCIIRTYKFAPMVSNHVNSDEHSYFYITTIKNEIIMNENVLMFDLNNIVGTIGGSLGLFIGFSFLSVIYKFYEYVLSVTR